MAQPPALALIHPVRFYPAFVAISEGIFWDEFSVRFNFIALDYLVFTTEVIGNIRQSYPVGKIIAVLLALTLSVVWLLRRPINRLALSSQAGWASCPGWRP